MGRIWVLGGVVGSRARGGTPQPQDGSWQAGGEQGWVQQARGPQACWEILGVRTSPCGLGRTDPEPGREGLEFLASGLPWPSSASVNALLLLWFIICLISSVLWRMRMTQGQTWAIQQRGATDDSRAHLGLQCGPGNQAGHLSGAQPGPGFAGGVPHTPVPSKEL